MTADVDHLLKGYHLWHPFTQMGQFLSAQRVVIERGEGPYLVDEHGKEYLNLTSCLWNVPLGLGQSAIIDAINDQLHSLGYASLFRASHKKAMELAALIAEVAPGNLNRVFLTSNGSESIETAIKMVRQFHRLRGSNKYKIISLKSAYHGVSYGALAASGFAEDKLAFAPLPEGFLQIDPPYCYRCPLGETYPACETKCALELEQAILREGPDTVAAFLMEPVLGFGGVIIPPAEYLPAVAAICKKYDITLLLDEVTTGYGRTGKLFASQHTGVTPDIMALGKAMSGGYFPLGATVATDEIWEEFLGDDNSTRFNHGSTNAGHPGACAAGIAMLNLLQEEKHVTRAADRGAFFFDCLSDLNQFDIVGEVRGIGMMFAIEFVANKQTKEPLGSEAMNKIVEACFARGLFVHLGGNKIILLPPFVLTEDLLEKAARDLRRVIGAAQHWF